METSLIVNQTATNNKKIQKTITYANPEASNANLKLFGQKLTGLTTNTFNGADRVNKQDVDEPDSGGGSQKLTPTFTLNFDFNNMTGTYTYNGDGEIFGYTQTSAQVPDDEEITPYPITIDREAKTVEVDGDYTGLQGDVWLYASEGENYAAAICHESN